LFPKWKRKNITLSEKFQNQINTDNKIAERDKIELKMIEMSGGCTVLFLNRDDTVNISSLSILIVYTWGTFVYLTSSYYAPEPTDEKVNLMTKVQSLNL
jgi:hypothetical protein